MSHNFSQVNNRRNTNSMKWDVKDGELPLWVADMDFKTAPAITKAIQERAATGIFGYTLVPDTWYEAIQSWWHRRHDFLIEKDWLVFTTGVVPALSTAVNRLTNVGDNVLIQTPVYNIFFNSIINHGRHVIENQLVYDDGLYQIDFDDLEAKLSHPLTTLMILCNPHNPVGKIWDKETLARIGDLCAKHDVVVVSDEIHCDITDPDKTYTPFASVNETCKNNSVVCKSATKAFNIAGLQTAFIAVPNKEIRNKMERGLNSGEVAEPNVFAAEAVIAAFNHGDAWLEDLRAYIFENKKIVKMFLNDNLRGVKLVDSEATYLLWLDISDLGCDAKTLSNFIREATGLYLSEGSQFGGDGQKFIRMNIACPKSVLHDALIRFKTGIDAFTNK